MMGRELVFLNLLVCVMISFGKGFEIKQLSFLDVIC